MLGWEDEDLNLPVSTEIEWLHNVFKDICRFETGIWKRPDHNCHAKLNRKFLDLSQRMPKMLRSFSLCVMQGMLDSQEIVCLNEVRKEIYRPWSDSCTAADISNNLAG